MKSKFLSILLILVSFTHLYGQQKSEGKQYEYLFPKPLKGWHASKVTIEVVKSLTGDLEYQSLIRKYSTNVHSVEVIININPDDELASITWDLLKKTSSPFSWQGVRDKNGFLLEKYGYSFSNKEEYRIVRFVDKYFGTVTISVGSPSNKISALTYYYSLNFKPILDYINKEKEIDESNMYDFF
jgi:hypothetical protein